MFFDQKQNRTFGMNLVYGPNQSDAFESGLVCVAQDGRIVRRPDPFERRQRAVRGVDVRVRQLEAQGRRQSVEKNSIVFNNEDTRGGHGVPYRKKMCMIPLRAT